jgi:hypothetical protein
MKTITLYLWDLSMFVVCHLLLINLLETKKYKPSSVSIKMPDGQKIINVVPSDFDHDGFLDLLVMSADAKDESSKSRIIKNQIYYGNGITLSTAEISLLGIHGFRWQWSGSSVLF